MISGDTTYERSSEDDVFVDHHCRNGFAEAPGFRKGGKEGRKCSKDKKGL